ncbi:hypothetical protein Tco_0622375 [Tanacetum coccineum]
MYKLDLVSLAPKDKNNRETHIYYLKDIMEQDAILREIVEQAKSLNPLDSASYSAYLEEEPAPTGDQFGPSAPPAPKIAKQLAARRNQERVKSILLLAIPDEYLLKFHNVADAKSL